MPKRQCRPARILSRVREEGIGAFSLTDHDAVRGCKEIRSFLRSDPAEPLFITGIEFSCKDELGKYHILGYGFDPDAKEVTSVLDRGHAFRVKKTEERLQFLEKTFGFHFPKEEIDSLFSLDNPGKPHIGNLMVRLGYAASKKEAIKEYIDKKRFGNEYIRPEEAISGILGSGGIPVLAHPSYGSGEELIVGKEMEERLTYLISYGLQGVEAFYSGFTVKLQEEMLSFAERFGLYVTAGSDYHGSNKMIPLGDTNLPDARSGPEGMARFFEDARFVQRR